MNFQQFATSEFGTRLWMGLGHYLPPRTGYTLARIVSSVLGHRPGSSLYRSIQGNQAVVLGPDAGLAEQHRAVRAVLQHAGKASYDLMHLAGLGVDAIRANIRLGPSVWADIEAARAGGRGVMFCGAHVSNFNLGFLSFALHNIPLQILSPPGPRGGLQMIVDLRSRGALSDTPIDAGSLRMAIKRLREGGLVLTGAEWPNVPWESEPLPFFGKPAHLPTGHIRLAMSGNARLLPVACRWDARCGYYVATAPPMDLELTGNRAADVRHNALRVLAVFERWIAERPEQWLMYYPVWG